MKCLVLSEFKQPLSLEERPVLEPGSGQVVVNLEMAALNRRDAWITQGMYPGIRTPVILGSDGAGIVVGVGPGVDLNWQGAEVILNPGLNWSGGVRAQGPDFTILGMPLDGTFAEQVLIDVEYVHHKPPHLDWAASAALPLAGLTAFRAVVTQGRVAPGQTVLVTGIGGGVATFAMQFATKLGARVLVTSSSQEKIERACELGAIAGFNYQEDGWGQQVLDHSGPVDLVIDSAAGAGYATLMDIASFGGRIVNYGATAGSPGKLDMFKLFWKQLTLQGSTMGSPEDFRSMLELVTEYGIVPAMDQTFSLSEGNLALQRMRDGEQFGKILLRIRD